ncbi:GNAT family N-acetyltransferase [Pseudomonas sp. CCI3.2]|uniref:GNAT family N-acetyltransferase n=1 Tax=unclassified Pseudomonas TaxID=196821 RepID=UPI002AC96DBA|nr:MULTISPECIES: GNAT family N-acetyltransferase [unclassified Pseudomonas]MEB0079728.1 GNAT family N-acetyltransferase [Pseudomonas sp. MH10out]MEB0103924.1 GNAT family N-acetyltransferase [Pseudomonas sp. CCI3.2]MEB0132165.1 GNAT family N-acetyltransferase [Pseudomonas sp. CCI2.4]MEB0157873.1 GNAT family N-acetyltransferase [Pseudomonas sp. AH2 (2023)]MEB0169577.1 GNAT family N-acetyltransferase [Pseudomonas sp. CCC4.4]
MNDICIGSFRMDDHQGVVELILSIQRREFGIDISIEDQPDLMSIASFYQTGVGDFVVARRNGVVIGTIGLKDIGNGDAALRKMFVAAEWRGREFHVAHQLLLYLLERAKSGGVHRIYLGTNASFLAAHRFYEKYGFELIERHRLPARFDVMAVDSRFYTLSL